MENNVGLVLLAILLLAVFAGFSIKRAIRLIKHPEIQRAAKIKYAQAKDEFAKSRKTVKTAMHNVRSAKRKTIDITISIPDAIPPRTEQIPKIVGALDFDIVPDRTIDIEYTDSTGNTSHRTITAQRIYSEKNGGIYIVGFCHMRKQMRSFRCDRIINIDAGTKSMSAEQFLTDVGFYSNRTTKELRAINKLQKMVQDMSDSDLDGFIDS